jgi:nucleoid DNA-binding protein
MQNVAFHIACLLTKHECVILPGFGAWVVSPAAASQIKESGVFAPPSQSIGFNPEVKHNDGLLAHAIAQTEKTSYQAAILTIQRYVNQLMEQLYANQTVAMEWIGRFSLSENQTLLFTPAEHLSCNASHFGLTSFYFPKLTELQIVEESAQKPVSGREVILIPVHKKTLAWTASVAAAVIALFALSTPLNNQWSPSPELRTQQATLFSFSTSTKQTDNEEFIAKDSIPSDTLTGKFVEEIIPELKQTPAPVARTQYYIVIASLPTKQAAKENLADLQIEFPEAKIISEKNRHRIYVRQLEEKREAEVYLRNFRREHPKYATAWLLGQ